MSGSQVTDAVRRYMEATEEQRSVQLAADQQVVEIKARRCQALRDLRELELSYRQIGEIIGLSAIRVHQLVEGPSETS